MSLAEAPRAAKRATASSSGEASASVHPVRRIPSASSGKRGIKDIGTARPFHRAGTSSSLTSTQTRRPKLREASGPPPGSGVLDPFPSTMPLDTYREPSGHGPWWLLSACAAPSLS